MNLLNRAVYGAAFRRYHKRLRVLPVLEKDVEGRFHYHCTMESPAHTDAVDFERLIHDCWSKVDWGYKHILVRENADRGWIKYCLKPCQKSALETWSDCIDWEALHNC